MKLYQEYFFPPAGKDDKFYKKIFLDCSHHAEQSLNKLYSRCRNLENKLLNDKELKNKLGNKFDDYVYLVNHTYVEHISSLFGEILIKCLKNSFSMCKNNNECINELKDGIKRMEETTNSSKNNVKELINKIKKIEKKYNLKSNINFYGGN